MENPWAAKGPQTGQGSHPFPVLTAISIDNELLMVSISSGDLNDSLRTKYLALKPPRLSPSSLMPQHLPQTMVSVG